LSIFNAAWKIIYRVLRSTEGARLRAISTLALSSSNSPNLYDDPPFPACFWG
jgi:hypothetical protein